MRKIVSTFIILILSSVLIPSIVSASTINEGNKVFDGKYYYIEQKKTKFLYVIKRLMRPSLWSC